MTCKKHEEKNKDCVDCQTCITCNRDLRPIPVIGLIVIHPEVEDAYILILKNEDVCVTTSKYYSAELIVPTAEVIAKEMNLEITWSAPPKDKSLIFIPQKRF